MCKGRYYLVRMSARLEILVLQQHQVWPPGESFMNVEIYFRILT